MSFPLLSPAQAQGAGKILDVCEPAEHEALHIPGATNVPLSRLEAEAKGLDPQESYVLACRSGQRAQLAAQRLQALGFPHLSILEGGAQAWQAAGLAIVTRGTGVWALERQIRMAAGLLVFSGVAVGTWVHPYGYGLAGFVGAGLIFAAATDTCAMGLLIAKMPWNRPRSPQAFGGAEVGAQAASATPRSA